MASKKTARKKTTRKAATKKTASRSSSSTSKKSTAKKSTRKKASTKSTASSRAPKTRRDGPFTVSREIGGRELSLETGRMAKLADGAIVARYGDTMVLATAQAAGHESDMGFFPLTVDYREKAAAAGKFPGGFFKREGRPTTREILTCRIIDRSIRPLFADGFKRETQVLIQVLSTDKENDSDMLAAVAGFAALAISSIPNGKTLGACRIGLVDGKLKINPTWSDLQSDDNRLNLTISAHSDAIVMVEAGADQVSEEVMLEALELGHEVCTEVADMIDELVEVCGKPKMEFQAPFFDQDLFEEIEAEFGDDIKAAPVVGGTKFDRGAAKDAIKREVREAFPAPKGADEKAAAEHKKQVDAALEKLFKQGERESILRGKRADGRGTTDIRDLSIEVGVLPRVHGSALFTRGETQSLCTATLGTIEDQQFIDGIYPEDRKRWILHYNFPPFSVGEVRRFGSPGRREIGHGALAERSVEPVLPSRDSFSYSMRVTSEILESNGSSSMASVCGATLALMDAGVPLSQPVAGIAMGLVVEGNEVAILSDILGSEDHCGDMDFKVSGTGKGITALQMDIKCEGLARETLEEALEQARKGRVHILRAMLATIREPRGEVSRFAPRLVTIQVPQEKVGAIIGPAGRTIRGMQEEFECRIAVMDEGRVEISGTDADKVDACIARIEEMTEDVQMGKTYTGKITGLKEFGCFVEILPGQEGLVHVSELAHGFIRSVADEVQVGDEIEVKVIDIDDFGKVKLSRKALLPAPEGEDGDGGDDRGRGRGRGPRDRDDDDRGGRDRGRGRGRRDRDEEVEPEPELEVDDDFELDAEFDDDEEAEFEPEFEEEDFELEAEVVEEERPAGRSRGRDRGPRRGRDDGDRPRRGRGRDGEDRPHRGRGRDDDDRPRRGRGRGREDEDRPARGRGREDGDRPAHRRGRDDEERPRRGRDDEDRPRRGRGRDEDDRPRHGRGRGGEDRRPPRGDDERPSRRARDEEPRPARSRRRPADDVEFEETRPEPAGGERRRRRRRGD